MICSINTGTARSSIRQNDKFDGEHMGTSTKAERIADSAMAEPGGGRLPTLCRLGWQLKPFGERFGYAILWEDLPISLWIPLVICQS